MRIKSLGPAVLLVALLVGAGVGLAQLDLDRLLDPLSEEPQIAPGTSEAAGQQDGPASANSEPTKKAGALSELARSLGDGGKSKPAGPSFDVARISPDGVSVFAGQAKPFERVNVLVGDLVVGTASADSEGNWTLVTEEKIPDPSAKLHLNTAAPDSTAEKEQKRAPPPPATGTAISARPESVADVNKRLFASLEGLVEEARATNRSKDEPVQTAATYGATATPGSMPNEEVKAVSNDASVSNGAPVAQVQARTIPIPVQFVFREAEFTEQGKAAVQLLLEYLKLSKLERVTLSGHADERGSDELNMQLSRDRLFAVRDRLRAGGYTGELILLPKGKTEPFAGVDRNAMPPEDLYQLDRRVELRLDG